MPWYECLSGGGGGDISEYLKAMEDQSDYFTFTSADLTSIRKNVFRESKVTNIDIPAVTYIGTHAFNGSSVHDINAPACITIAASAFYGCKNLANATLYFPSVETISDYAFQNANVQSGVQSIDLSSVKTIGFKAFQDCGFWKDSSNTKILNLPECTTLGEQVFDATVTTWGNRFAHIYLPKIVNLGGTGSTALVFRRNYCTNLHIGPNCTKIAGSIFWSGKVNNIYIEATTPPTLYDTFGSDASVVDNIYVPENSVNAYKSANKWSTYSSKIQALPT